MFLRLLFVQTGPTRGIVPARKAFGPSAVAIVGLVPIALDYPAPERTNAVPRREPPASPSYRDRGKPDCRCRDIRAARSRRPSGWKSPAKFATTRLASGRRGGASLPGMQAACGSE